MVAKGENTRVHRRRLKNNDSNLRRLMPTVPDITCAADETPCHDEPGTTLSCARKGMACPCFGNERRCTDPHFGDYCDTVCCEWGVQERCQEPDHDSPGQYNFNVWCANIADGGCSCPDGEMKCGEMETDGGFTGYCTSLCCDGDDHQTCYDENSDPSYCALISEGGCPCTEGKSKCGATDDWAGYCTDICCESDEETCYDDPGKMTCKQISLGGCSLDTSYVYWQSQVASTILTKGNGGQISYFHAIKNREKLLAASDMEMVKNLESEESALFHSIRLRYRERSTKEDVTSIS